MNTYNIKQIKAIQKENDFKFAALENAEGRKIISFNTSPTTKVTITKQLEAIEKRLNSSTLGDGYYFVLFCSAIKQCKDGYEKFAIIKGRPTQEPPTQTTVVLHENVQNVLSYEQALAYQNEIAQLKFDKKLLEKLNTELGQRVAQLEKEVELSENEQPQKSILSKESLSEFGAMATPIIDRYFDLEEKKLDLQKNGAGKTAMKAPAKQLIKVGSDAHLNLIEKLFKEGEEDKMNAQLDILEAQKPELYKTVIEILGLEEENEEEQEENEEQ